MSIAFHYQLAEKNLLARQSSSGEWSGEVELNPGPTAQVIMLFAAISREFPKELRAKAKAYILEKQNADGGWSTHFGQPSDVSVSCECYTGLRLLGLEASDPVVLKARECIQNLGGVAKANPWTQLYLAVLGVVPWNSIIKTPLEIMLLPKWSPTQIDDLSYWVRVITVPMALLGRLGPAEPIPLSRSLQTELGLANFSGLLSSDQKYAKYFDYLFKSSSFLFSSKSREAQRKAWDVIENFTEASGDFGGNTCTALNVLLALHCDGRGSEARFEKGLSALMSYGIERGETWRVQTCQSHVWDTGFALTALEANTKNKAAINKGLAALRSRQILKVKGDWAHNVRAQPGGWCFGNYHDKFPVTDCTALAVQALAKHDPDFKNDKNFIKAIAWLCEMQHEGGGWSAYQKYTRGKWLNRVVKFKDIDNALVDVPKCDVSAKVLEALAFSQLPQAKTSLKKGRQFLLKERNKQNLWAGNYGVNFIYGTSFCAKALRAIDGEVVSEWARPVEQFFIETQNSDGGWGEADHVGEDFVAKPVSSSAVQTAWALTGLAACYDGRNSEIKKVLKQGAQYLCENQNSDGSWTEPRFLGTVFKGSVYFRYELYSQYFPMLALKAVEQ